MTHSLHRQGKASDLVDDYVVFAISAQGINAKGSAPLFRRFIEIVKGHNPANLGDMRTGNRFSTAAETISQGTQDNSIVHAVFTDPATVAAVLAELKREDLGLSIVVSGLFQHVAECCRSAGLERHTIEHSLGVWGRTDRLPPRPVVEVSTMCGHGMVGFPLIEDQVRRIRQGELTPRQAAETLAGRCHCGIFNPVRAERLLAAMAAVQPTMAIDPA
jgi:hypothetical protein